MKNAVILCLLLAAAALAQQKQRVVVLPSVGDMTPQRLILLTDKVREIATKNLPIENFNILKQDAIIKMIGEEELYRACKEGVCIGDLARKTNANYGARCDVIKLDNRLVLKFELYSVNEDAIFETFTDYNVKDFYGMLDVLEARLPAAFKKIIAAKKEVTGPQIMPAVPKLPVAIVPPKPASVTTFTDSRDGKAYKKVKIGSQTWMAEDLNYDVPDVETDVCYNKSWDYCARYGRLYNWNTAMGGSSSSSSNPSGVRGVCPVGWHIPSAAEWTTLVNAAGGPWTAGRKLKSTTGWNNSGNGTDDYGFSALPGGGGYRGGVFSYVDELGHWWSATAESVENAWLWRMDYNKDKVNSFSDGKIYQLSVRCVQD